MEENLIKVRWKDLELAPKNIEAFSQSEDLLLLRFKALVMEISSLTQLDYIAVMVLVLESISATVNEQITNADTGLLRHKLDHKLSENVETEHCSYILDRD